MRVPARRKGSVNNIERGELIEVESSQILSIGYTTKKQILQIMFVKNVLYEYYNFSKEDFEKFKSSESIGKYLHYNIKGKYEYRKVDDKKIDTKYYDGDRVFNEKYGTGTLLQINSPEKMLVSFDNIQEPLEVSYTSLYKLKK